MKLLPLSSFTLNPNLATMQSDDGVADCQPQPRPARLAVLIALLESFENRLLHFL